MKVACLSSLALGAFCLLGCSSAFQVQHFGCSVSRESPITQFPTLSSKLPLASSGLQGNEPLTNVEWLQDQFNFSEEWRNRSRQRNLQSMNRTVMIDRMDWLQKRLKLTRKEQATILRKQPQILGLRPDTNLEPTIIFLQDKLAVNTKALSRIIQTQPAILGNGIKETQTLHRNLNWIAKRLNFSNAKDMGNIVRRCPQLIYLSVDNNLDPTFEMLQKRLNLNETQVAKMFIKSPHLFTLNFSTGIEPTLNWLHDRLNLDDIQLGKMIKRNPKLLLSNAEASFEPNLTWLQERLLLDYETVRFMIIRQPSLLTYSVSEKMEPLLQWLQEELALENVHELAAVMVLQPRLFDLNIPNNLQPTLNFYKDCIGDEAAVQLLRKCPICFTLSLEKRLKPRLEQAQQLGIVVDII